MTNPVISFFGKVGKILEWPFVHAAQVIGVLTVTLTQYPLVRTAVIGLITQIQTNVQDVALAAADKGLNVSADVAELAAAKSLWVYVTQVFMPAIEAAYNAESATALLKSQAAVKANATRSAAKTLTSSTTAAQSASLPGSATE